jgi:outer membrane protein assembly factor BamA
MQSLSCRRSLLSASLLVLLSPTAHAADPTLPDVVVTATRAPTPRAQVLAATTVLERAESVDTNMGTQSVTFHSNMLRFLCNFAFYVPILPKLVFASQWRYGRVVHLDANSQSYPNRRFYLGGTNFRGFNQNQMIPQDLENQGIDETNIVSRGAETFIAGQNELRFPLVGDLYGGLFTDVGNLWADPKKLDPSELEVVVGAGLRFQTPVASLAFDYGVRAIHTNPFEMIGAFQFAFQTF